MVVRAANAITAMPYAHAAIGLEHAIAVADGEEGSRVRIDRRF